MVETTRDERLQVLLTAAELEALDTWRFAHRMPSRAAAIRELLKRGLEAAAAPAQGRARSQDIRIIREGRPKNSNGRNGRAE